MCRLAACSPEMTAYIRPFRRFTAALSHIADGLLPADCTLCGEPAPDTGRVGRVGRGLCAWCLTSLPGLNRRRCRVCALALSGDPGDPANDICAGCAFHPPAYHASWVLADYAMPLDRLIHVFKYRHRPNLIEPVARALAARVVLPLPGWPTRVLAVPLATGRLRARGYNQSLLIARIIARHWRCPLDIDTLVRHRATRVQRDLPLVDRGANVAGAFACRTRLDGERIALVDDVMTTGTTLHWAAVALREAGAASVICLALARTPPPGRIT